MIASEEHRQDTLPVIGLNSFDRYLIAIATFFALLAAYYVGFYRGDYARLSDGREPIATILSTSNSVKTKIAGLLIWEKAVDAAKLADQDQIFTDQGSAALIELDGAGKIDISENSLVVVQSGSNGSSLDVLQGTVFVTLTDASKALTVKVRNSTTRLITKDARVQFRATKDKTSIIVVGGAASLAGSGDAVNVGKNQMASVNSDGSISLVEDLPALLIAPAHMKTIPVKGERSVIFKWETRGEPGTSRLEISQDDQFSELIHAAEVPTTEYDLKGLEFGRYFWRVGGKTASGNELYGETREFDIIESLPPKLLTPTDRRNFQLTVFGQKQKKTTATVVFEWSSNLRNSGYIVDIFRDTAAKENLIKSTSTRDMVLRYDLPAGAYVWRVTPDTDLENSSRLGSFSVDAAPELETAPTLEAPLLDDEYDIDLDQEESDSFIQPILDFLEPAAYAAETDDDSKKFVRWKPVQGAASYQVEIAKDEAFTEVFISEQVDEPQLKWPKQASGKYFMRVYAIDRTGTKGTPSNVAVVHARQQSLQSQQSQQPIAPPEPLVTPVTVSPDDNEIFRPSNEGLARVKFVWDSSSKQPMYELQVAKDNTFKNLVVSREKITDNSVITIIGPGKYFHRIRSVRENDKGPFSEPSAFVVLRVPPVITSPGPGSRVKLAKHDHPTPIRWRSSPAKADQFLLEISKDSRFRTDVVKYNNYNPAIDVDLPNGTYFARVRLAGNQMNSSDFSQPVKFSVERPPLVIVKRPPRQWRTLSPFIYGGYYPAVVEYQLDRGTINKSFTGEYTTSYKVALGMDIGATQTEASYRFRETTFIGSEKTGETYTDLETTKKHEEFAVIFRRKFGTPDTAVVWMPEIGYSKRQIELFNINSDNALSFQTVTTRGLMAGLNSIFYITDALTASLSANYTSLSKFSHSENSEGISNEIVGNSKTVGGQTGLNWNLFGSLSLMPAINFEQITYSLENNVDRDNTDIKITELGVFVGGGYSF